MLYRKNGFTLIEIIIVVTIIAVLLAIIVPNYIKNRGIANENICESNRQRIAGELSRYMFDYPGVAATDVTMAMLIPDYLRKPLNCSAGGTYTVDDPVTCSIHGGS